MHKNYGLNELREMFQRKLAGEGGEPVKVVIRIEHAFV